MTENQPAQSSVYPGDPEECDNRLCDTCGERESTLFDPHGEPVFTQCLKCRPLKDQPAQAVEELPQNCQGEDCPFCTGEGCLTHHNKPCECDTAERHMGPLFTAEHGTPLAENQPTNDEWEGMSEDQRRLARLVREPAPAPGGADVVIGRRYEHNIHGAVTIQEPYASALPGCFWALMDNGKRAVVDRERLGKELPPVVNHPCATTGLVDQKGDLVSDKPAERVAEAAREFATVASVATWSGIYSMALPLHRRVDELEREARRLREALAERQPRIGGWANACPLCGEATESGDILHRAECPFVIADPTLPKEALATEGAGT